MIEMICMAFGLDSYFKAHSRELGVMPLYNENRSGENKRDFL